MIFPVTASAQSITLAIDGITHKTGTLQIALYSGQENFLDHDAATLTLQVELSAESDSVATIVDVPPGEYAVAIFLDENRNGKLDTRLIGIPKERYGFSNNARPRFRAPQYAEAAFTVTDGTYLQRITLH